MIRENSGGDESGAGGEGGQSEPRRQVVDANAWTDQRGTDEGNSVLQAGRESTQLASTAVVGALANWYETSTLDLYPPLYESIDPDALDQFLACSAGQVEFDYREVTVTIDHEYNVNVSDGRERR